MVWLLDLEHRLDDSKTTARVMGARLEAEAGDSSVLLGAGAAWQRDTLKINAGLTAREDSTLAQRATVPAWTSACSSRA